MFEITVPKRHSVSLLEGAHTQQRKHRQLCHILANLIHARMNAAPGLEARVDILAKNLVQRSLFRVKLDCRVNTLWRHVSSIEDVTLFCCCFLKIKFMITAGGHRVEH